MLLRICTTLLLLAFLAACSSAPAESPPPPSTETINGQPFDFAGSIDVRLPYGTYDGYPSSTDGSNEAVSLDRLLSGPPRPTQPVVTAFDQLDAPVQAEADVTRRAILVTQQRALGRQPLDLLPNMYRFLAKPEEAAPSDPRYDDFFGPGPTFTFAHAYIEQQGNDRRVALVTGTHIRPANQPERPDDTFFVDRGITTYRQTLVHDAPADARFNRIEWRAIYLQPDCTAERTYRDRYSSTCTYLPDSSAQRYAGQANVILVTPVGLAMSHYQSSATDARMISEVIGFLAPVTRESSQYVFGLYENAMLRPPDRQSYSMSDQLAGPFTILGGDDIAGLPAFTVLN